jgi:hypothetical protein
MFALVVAFYILTSTSGTAQNGDVKVLATFTDPGVCATALAAVKAAPSHPSTGNALIKIDGACIQTQ